MKINLVQSKEMLVKSNLPASDYVINPYVGCPHKCRYCYACFMKRFTGHEEPWGDFLDIKEFQNRKISKNLNGKVVLISSVTDPYNPYEKRFHKSREAINLIKDCGANIEILTKSDLILEDIELLKSVPKLRVGISIATLDDDFRRDIEPGAPSIERRLNAIKVLHNSGIDTYVFISPIFPMITDVRGIIESVHEYVSEVCFENLNLRGAYKEDVMKYIQEKHPEYLGIYREIYYKGNQDYWKNMEKDLDNWSRDYSVKFTNYFYHDEIKGGRRHD